jgi:splicing factor 3B subunit 1
MIEQNLRKEEADVRKSIQEKKKAGELPSGGQKARPAKRNRWDKMEEEPPKKKSAWDQADAVTPSTTRWGETPARSKAEQGEATPKIWDATPTHTTPRRNRWDETPKVEKEETSGWAETPRADTVDVSSTPGSRRRSRWDETPQGQLGAATPSTPSFGGATPLSTGPTPAGAMAMQMATPTPGHLGTMTPEQLQAYRWEQEIDFRNRPLSDEELDSMLPTEGYKVLDPPANYHPIRTPVRKLTATPTPVGMAGFSIQADDRSVKQMDDQAAGGLPFIKPEDAQYFDKLLVDIDETTLGAEELKERKIMKLLLKIKNGTPPMRKSALRQITDKAREFGAGPLFNQILPLLMSPTLEDQERHLLVKVIDRILYKLDDLVRPYVHKILVVIEPLLIDEDYYARVEGREIISNLAKAAGLATMISTMRPDIDNIDEYVRNTTARAFAVVSSALGIPSLLPFLKAVCRSKKSWQARHTGIKIVQQISILMGCAVLPHLKSLVEIIEHGLIDEQQKVRTITALALAALAEAATPYGIEAFDSVLKPLWKGIRNHRGKGLAAFLKAIGYLIPLMDAEYANYYTREVMIILIREFQSPDEEMKKIVLKVVKQCCATDGVEPAYIRSEILPEFFKHFWNHRMAMDRRNYRQLVDTTVEIAGKVGAADIVSRVVDDLKDESEQYRKMVMETVEKILGTLGAAEIDSRLEEQLIDGILYAFQEQTTEVNAHRKETQYSCVYICY